MLNTDSLIDYSATLGYKLFIQITKYPIKCFKYMEEGTNKLLHLSWSALPNTYFCLTQAEYFSECFSFRGGNGHTLIMRTAFLMSRTPS